MFVARSIAADHKDLIHDVSYDFHGRRMATCSSDQSVKVMAGESTWSQGANVALATECCSSKNAVLHPLSDFLMEPLVLMFICGGQMLYDSETAARFGLLVYFVS